MWDFGSQFPSTSRRGLLHLDPTMRPNKFTWHPPLGLRENKNWHLSTSSQATGRAISSSTNWSLPSFFLYKNHLDYLLRSVLKSYENGLHLLGICNHSADLLSTVYTPSVPNYSIHKIFLCI